MADGSPGPHQQSTESRLWEGRVLCRPDRPQSLWSIQGDYSRREVDSPFSENETMRKSLESLSRKGQVRKRGGGLISLFQMCVGLLDRGETSHVGAAPDSK